MDSLPSVDAVQDAVFTLYHCPDSTQKERASRWLQDFQKSVYSWKIADQILHEKRNIESCYIAAQTIRTKIKYSFLELPIESHSSLRDSLIDHIRQADSYANPAITTQLCLAVSDLALQMTDWHSPVLDMMNIFGETHPHLMLQVLSVVPEEANSSSLRLGANRRTEILNSLISVSNTVEEYMSLCLTKVSDSQMQIKLFNCFISWVSIQDLFSKNFTRTIVNQAFGILKDCNSTVEMHNAATETLRALLPFLRDKDQESLEFNILNGVMELEECFLWTVAHDVTQKSVNLCSIFCELADSLLEKILTESSAEQPHSPIKILDLILKCMGHDDCQVVEITFNFWYELSAELRHKNCESLNNVFKPYIGHLLVYLRRLCEIDSDQKGLLEDRDLIELRDKVSDLLKDLAFIPGTLNCFHLLFLSLQQPCVTWNLTEATLFLMKSIANKIYSIENDAVHKVVHIILNTPESTHIAVRYTSLLLLGELSVWLKNQPELIEVVLNFLFRSVQHHQLSTGAVLAIQNICCSNRDYMTAHLSSLFQIIQFMDTFGVSHQASIELLIGVSLTLSRLPIDHIEDSMEQICQLQIICLNQLVENDVKPEKDSNTDPGLYLDRLATVFKYVTVKIDSNSVHPCFKVFKNSWPVLSKIFNKYQDNVRIMEKCCRCLRFAIRCVGTQSSQILEPLLNQIVSLYEIHSHSCFLYLGSILVDEYGSEPSCAQGLVNMLHVFVNFTLRIFKDELGLKNNPDTVDDLFRLCTKFLQTMPLNFLQADIFPCIWDCGIFACVLDHKDANASVMKFFSRVINVGGSQRDNEYYMQCKSLVKEVLKNRGFELLNTLLQSVVFHLHSYMLYDVSNVILELKNIDKSTFCEWLQISLQFLRTQNSGCSITVTEAQLGDFYQSLNNAEKTRDVSKILKEFVSLYI